MIIPVPQPRNTDRIKIRQPLTREICTIEYPMRFRWLMSTICDDDLQAMSNVPFHLELVDFFRLVENMTSYYIAIEKSKLQVYEMKRLEHYNWIIGRRSCPKCSKYMIFADGLIICESCGENTSVVTLESDPKNFVGGLFS